MNAVEPPVDQVVLSNDARLTHQVQCRDRLAQLAAPFESTMPVWRWRPDPSLFDAEHGRWDGVEGWHSVELPSLMEQVLLATSGSRGASSTTGVWESRPTVKLEAIDVAEMITSQADRFCRSRLHYTPTGVADALTTIARRVPTLVDEDLLDLVVLVRSWWTSARVVSGLEEPPLQPHVRCPLCEKQDSISTRMDIGPKHQILLARCRACGETWDETNVGLLIEEIKLQESAPREPKVIAPRVDYVYAGTVGDTKRWAIASGVETSRVYPAEMGVAGLEGLRGPVRLVLPPGWSSDPDPQGVIAQVVDFVRDVNVQFRAD